MVEEIFVCFCKELKFYFQSKIIYFVLPLYAALTAGLTFYATDFFEHTSPNMLQFFRPQPDLMALVAPLLTMRLWADEAKHQTLEVLFSQPLRYASIVLGKFFAAWVVIGLMLCASFGVWGIAAIFVPLENGWILANYGVTFLMAGCLCALSLFVSSLILNAAGAFLLSLAACHVFVSLSFGWAAKYLFVEHTVLEQVFKTVDFKAFFEQMILGKISISGLLYYFLGMAAFIGLTVCSIDFKRK